MSDTIRLGPESAFWLDCRYISIAVLDSTHFVVAYRDATMNDEGKAVIGTIGSNNVITWGTIAEFNSVYTQHIDVSALDSTHFVITYDNYDIADEGGVGIIGSVSGNTITYGAKNKFTSGSPALYTSVAALDSTHFVVTYREGVAPFGGAAIVGVVSGSTITSYGTKNTFYSVPMGRNDVEALDSTHFVVVYYDSARVGLVSGTTISSYGTAVAFKTGDADHYSVDTFDNTRFVISYEDSTNGGYATAIIGIVSGTTISSFGSPSVMESTSSQYTSVGALDSTHFVTVFQDSSWTGNAIIGNVSGSTIGSYGAKKVMDAGSTKNLCCDVIDGDYFVAAYNATPESYARLCTTLPIDFVPTIIIT